MFVSIVDRRFDSRPAQRSRKTILIAASKPHARRRFEQAHNRIRVRLLARDPHIARVRSKTAKLDGFLFAASLADGACHREHDDARPAPSAREVDEVLDELGRLRTTTDDLQRTALGRCCRRDVTRGIAARARRQDDRGSQGGDSHEGRDVTGHV
jgi:hypothetical protein